MIPAKHLKRAGKKQTAASLHDKYDVVPFPYRGAIKGYFYKNDQGPHNIDRTELLGGATSILDVIGLFREREFFFVLYGNEISGYLHFSDLNHPHTRVPIFGMLQLLEQYIWETISRYLDDAIVQQVLQENWHQIIRRRQANHRRNLDTGWASILYLPELMTLGMHLKKVNITPAEKEAIVDLRNKVMHPAKKLISSFPDLKKTIAALNSLRKHLRDI
jgi:hypothetical protein